MWNSRAIQHPFGISVFGSAQTRVEPDHVSILVSVQRLQPTPAQAFAEAKKDAAAVQNFLQQQGQKECGTSQIQLEQKTHKDELRGYLASIKFHIVLRNLDLLETTISGIVEAGGDRIHSVVFGTTQLKELRQEMREQAVREALQKAQIYARAAAINLGNVIHIEDVDPEAGQNNYSMHYGNKQPNLEETNQALNPASIIVRGAVLLGIELV
jgi:uncharacterized protein